MFYWVMMYYPMFFLSLSSWNELGHLPDTQGYSDPRKVIG